MLREKILDQLEVGDAVKLSRVSGALHTYVKYHMRTRKKFDFSRYPLLSPFVTRHRLKSLLSKNTRICELDFTNCREWLSDVFLIPLLLNSRHLKRLCLRDCQNRRISDWSMYAIAGNCLLLEELIFDGCNWFTSNAFTLLGTKCKLLRTLSLRNCSTIDNESLAVVLRNNCHLRELNLRYCKQFGEEVLETISETCKELRVLDISRWSNVSDVTALKLVRGCKRIEEVNLTQTPISNWSLRLIANAYGSSLHSVSLAASEADDLVLENIASNNEGKLKHLDLSFCHRITDYGLASLSKHCQKITALNLTTCLSVSNVGFEMIACNCQGLTELILEDCDWVKSESLHIFALHCRSLKRINLKGCSATEDESLIALFENNSDLASINLSGCCKVTAAAIMTLANCCRGITELSMQGCVGISDSGLRHLALCKDISLIDLEGCSMLSAKSLALLGVNCRRIRRMTLSGCRRVNCRSLMSVVVNNPNLEYIDVSECFPKSKFIINLVKNINKKIFVDF